MCQSWGMGNFPSLQVPHGHNICGRFAALTNRSPAQIVAYTFLVRGANRADVALIRIAIYECYEFSIKMLRSAVSCTIMSFRIIGFGEALIRFIRILDPRINTCLLRSWKDLLFMSKQSSPTSVQGLLS
jgi:hypothetical protein